MRNELTKKTVVVTQHETYENYISHYITFWIVFVSTVHVKYPNRKHYFVFEIRTDKVSLA